MRMRAIPPSRRKRTPHSSRSQWNGANLTRFWSRARAAKRTRWRVSSCGGHCSQWSCSASARSDTGMRPASSHCRRRELRIAMAASLVGDGELGQLARDPDAQQAIIIDGDTAVRKAARRPARRSGASRSEPAEGGCGARIVLQLDLEIPERHFPDDVDAPRSRRQRDEPPDRASLPARRTSSRTRHRQHRQFFMATAEQGRACAC